MRLLRVAREHRAASVAAVDRERRSETLSCIVLSPQLPNARVFLHMAAPEGASAFTKRGYGLMLLVGRRAAPRSAPIASERLRQKLNFF